MVALPLSESDSGVRGGAEWRRGSPGPGPSPMIQAVPPSPEPGPPRAAKGCQALDPRPALPRGLVGPSRFTTSSAKRPRGPSRVMARRAVASPRLRQLHQERRQAGRQAAGLPVHACCRLVVVEEGVCQRQPRRWLCCWSSRCARRAAAQQRQDEPPERRRPGSRAGAERGTAASRRSRSGRRRRGFPIHQGPAVPGPIPAAESARHQLAEKSLAEYIGKYHLEER